MSTSNEAMGAGLWQATRSSPRVMHMFATATAGQVVALVQEPKIVETESAWSVGPSALSCTLQHVSFQSPLSPTPSRYWRGRAGWVTPIRRRRTNRLRNGTRKVGAEAAERGIRNCSGVSPGVPAWLVCVIGSQTVPKIGAMIETTAGRECGT